MSFSATVVKDSTRNGYRVTTLQLRYWRPIHGEFLTHRDFSRSSGSSRAIPVKKMIAQVWNDPAMPLAWGANQPGMQAKSQLQGIKLKTARGLWRFSAKVAASIAWGMDKVGLHKQVANRILEPFQWMQTVVTATNWQNFFKLRCHPDAQPEFQHLAKLIEAAMVNSVPTELGIGEWHLPYVQPYEAMMLPIETQIKLSVARCARVSFLNHDNSNPVIEKDIDLFEKLVGSEPLHASPSEHQATPAPVGLEGTNGGNFNAGWWQLRKFLEQGITVEQLVRDIVPEPTTTFVLHQAV